jgi:hypothetical protein
MRRFSNLQVGAKAAEELAVARRARTTGVKNFMVWYCFGVESESDLNYDSYPNPFSIHYSSMRTQT